ncbi:EamA family transporter [Ruania halotolerans]|uniref:EamA family transporter n=1 Tax=Ruania halotolerans TaxID=2897773 RepID=UPI001E35DDB4|nr:EamA family transporter [Ruania halotolerans]UFU05964.1 EamA family transporter [Ruania halotolerans]
MNAAREQGGERGNAAMDRIPAPLLFLAAGTSQYIGAALAVGLYATIPATSVAWARGAVGAVILFALVRPWRLRWTRRELAQTGLFGVVLLGMNMLFYVAIDHLPLGAAVAIEFAGPVVVAAWGGRSVRHRFAVVLAAAGVLAISLVGLNWNGERTTAELALGLAAALGAGVLWAGYMVIGGRIVKRRSGVASLAMGLTFASLLYAPLTAAGAVSALSWPIGITLALVGLLSTVVPYTLDQVTLKRLGTATFALLNALLPVSATVIGVLALRQIPTWGEVAGTLAVSAAVWISAPRKRPRPGSALEHGSRGEGH